MGLLTPCFVPREGLLYIMIVPRGGFLLPLSRVPGVCPGGMVLDEIDTCIIGSKKHVKYLAYFVTKSNGFEKRSEVLGLLCHKE